MKMKFAVVILFGIFGSISSEVLSTIPQSKNVTVGSEVEFLCGTNDSSLNVIWFHSEDVTATQIREDLPEGGYIMKLQVTALVEYNDSRYSCYLLNGINQLALEEVTLLVQGSLSIVGNLSFTQNDPCSIFLSWTAPYSLDNVPVMGYNITLWVEGDFIMHETINITSYKLIPQLYNGTYVIEVSAVNKVGEGNTTSISVPLTNEINSTLLNYYNCKNEKQWKLYFGLQGLCMSNIQKSIFQVCQQSLTNCSIVTLFTNNTQLINYTNEQYNNTAFSLMTVLLTLSESMFLSLNFTIKYITQQKQVSTNFIINTNDIQTVTITDLSTGRVCIFFSCRHNKSVGATIVLKNELTSNDIVKNVHHHNGSTICKMQTCLTDIPTGTYTLHIYDLENAVISNLPAVVITSVSIVGSLFITTRSIINYDLMTTSILLTTNTNSLTLTETIVMTSLVAMESSTISLENNMNIIIISSSIISTFMFTILVMILVLVIIGIWCWLKSSKQEVTTETVEPVYINVAANNLDLPHILSQCVDLKQCPAYDTVNKVAVYDRRQTHYNYI